MAKILLVEDDQSLREIYSIRLTAEGYEIVSAGDGEEALASAVREKPDLVLSDVMMPKISGFDMLDILRQTPETKDIKVIMMTALSSEDQRERGNALGADRYLVKSQVGIEDVVNAVHEVLGDNADAVQAAPAPVTSEPVAAQPVAAEPVMTQPVVTEPVVTQPVATESVVAQPVMPTQPVVTEPVMPQPVVTEPVIAQPVAAEPVVAQPVMPTSDQPMVQGNGIQA